MPQANIAQFEKFQLKKKADREASNEPEKNGVSLTDLLHNKSLLEPAESVVIEGFIKGNPALNQLYVADLLYFSTEHREKANQVCKLGTSAKLTCSDSQLFFEVLKDSIASFTEDYSKSSILQQEAILAATKMLIDSRQQLAASAGANDKESFEGLSIEGFPSVERFKGARVIRSEGYDYHTQ